MVSFQKIGERSFEKCESCGSDVAVISLFVMYIGPLWVRESVDQCCPANACDFSDIYETYTRYGVWR